MIADNSDFETPTGLDLEARDRWFAQAAEGHGWLVTHRSLLRPHGASLHGKPVAQDYPRQGLVRLFPHILTRPTGIRRLLEAWRLRGNEVSFVVLGKRTAGTKAQPFAMTGPKCEGTLPDGVELICAPTAVG